MATHGGTRRSRGDLGTGAVAALPRVLLKDLSRRNAYNANLEPIGPKRA